MPGGSDSNKTLYSPLGAVQQLNAFAHAGAQGVPVQPPFGDLQGAIADIEPDDAGELFFPEQQAQQLAAAATQVQYGLSPGRLQFFNHRPVPQLMEADLFLERFFLLSGGSIVLLAFYCIQPHVDEPGFDPSAYYKDVIGVTVNEGNRPRNVRIWIDRANAPYVLTKPLHPSQEVVEERPDGVVVKIRVKQNFELERRILGFGPAMEVLRPACLRRRIREQLEKAWRRYEEETYGIRS